MSLIMILKFLNNVCVIYCMDLTSTWTDVKRIIQRKSIKVSISLHLEGTVGSQELSSMGSVQLLIYIINNLWDRWCLNTFTSENLYFLKHKNSYIKNMVNITQMERNWNVFCFAFIWVSKQIVKGIPSQVYITETLLIRYLAYMPSEDFSISIKDIRTAAV